MSWFRRSSGLPKIEHIRRVQIGPDDTIIISIPDPIDAQQAQDIKQRIAHALATDKILILADGIRIDLATPTGACDD